MKQVVVNLHDSLDKHGLTYGTDWNQHVMVHDEIQISVKPELVSQVSPLVLDSFIQAGEFYGFRCPIEGDIKTGQHWAETH